MTHMTDFSLAVIKGQYTSDAEGMYWYAQDVIKGKWPEAEPVIMKDPTWAYHYACNVIVGRWPEAEPVIMKDTDWASQYTKDMMESYDTHN